MKTDSKGHECVFCPENGKVNIIAVSNSEKTYLVQTLVKTEQGMEPAEGAYFVIPTDHHEDYSTLEFDFLREVVELKEVLGETFDNEGFNLTPEGGKLAEHMHYWLMQVRSGDPALGLYTLRALYRKTKRELSQEIALLRQDLSRGRRQGW